MNRIIDTIVSHKKAQTGEDKYFITIIDHEDKKIYSYDLSEKPYEEILNITMEIADRDAVNEHVYDYHTFINHSTMEG